MKSSSPHKIRRGSKDYFTKTIVYLIILLAITISVVFIAINPVTSLVHRVEEHFAVQSRDIVLNDSAYAPNTAENAAAVNAKYGDKIANITSDDFALNCSVYYGSNRITMKTGAGLHTDSDMPSDGTSLILGYAESCFSSLEYCEKGDVITITTNYGEYNYRVNDIKYVDSNATAYKKAEGNKLVLCALTSDFSQHRGENLYIFADMIEGEAD